MQDQLNQIVWLTLFVINFILIFILKLFQMRCISMKYHQFFSFIIQNKTKNTYWKMNFPLKSYVRLLDGFGISVVCLVRRRSVTISFEWLLLEHLFKLDMLQYKPRASSMLILKGVRDFWGQSGGGEGVKNVYISMHKSCVGRGCSELREHPWSDL